MTQLASIVGTLSQAGYKADEKELSDRFGLKLRYEPPAAVPAMGNSFSMSAEPPTNALSSALEEWLGPLVEKLSDLSDRSDLSDLSDLLATAEQSEDGSDKLGSSSKFEELLLSDMKRAIR